MNIAHLTASTCYGGPERQMLGLARALKEEAVTRIMSFSEKGRCRSFLSMARHQGIEAVALEADTPYFRSAIREIVEYLQQTQTDILFCHGYKANLLGRKAARRLKIPVVAVSRGWTAETWRVRLYEAVDRWCLGAMDRVICVSEAQAERVRRAGVKPDRLNIIVNAVDPERFCDPDPTYQKKLHRYFRQPRTRLIGAAGRLSPEKGFSVLLEAAEQVLQVDPSIGFVIFGDGPCRAELVKQISARGLVGSVVLCGFRADLDRFMPFFDLFVLPSFTEGMPNVILEAFAAGVPVVATAVGGTPELVEDGLSGYLVPPGDPATMADRICDALASEPNLRDMGLHGRERILQEHSFTAQADEYLELIDDLLYPESEESLPPGEQESDLPSPGEEEAPAVTPEQTEAAAP